SRPTGRNEMTAVAGRMVYIGLMTWATHTRRTVLSRIMAAPMAAALPALSAMPGLAAMPARPARGAGALPVLGLIVPPALPWTPDEGLALYRDRVRFLAEGLGLARLTPDGYDAVV